VPNREFAELAADPATRRHEYRRLVRSYFDHVTDVYLDSWSESLELLDEKTIAGIRDLPADAIPPALRWVTDRGIALAEAARSGAFLIGYWRARKRRPGALPTIRPVTS
jgi:hypothetical protein